MHAQLHIKLVAIASLFLTAQCAHHYDKSTATIIPAASGPYAVVTLADMPPQVQSTLVDGHTVVPINAFRPPNFTFYSQDLDVLCGTNAGQSRDIVSALNARGGDFTLPANVHVRIVKPASGMIWTPIVTDDNIVGNTCVDHLSIDNESK